MTTVVHRLIAPRENLPVRPAVLTVAVWAYLVTAAANILLTVFTDVLIVIAIGNLERAGKASPGAGVPVVIVITGLIAVAYSLTLTVLALRLRAGSGRARPALLTVSILSLFVIVSQGPALLVIPLLVGCAVIVTRRPITIWLRSVQGLPPA